MIQLNTISPDYIIHFQKSTIKVFLLKKKPVQGLAYFTSTPSKLLYIFELEELLPNFFYFRTLPLDEKELGGNIIHTVYSFEIKKIDGNIFTAICANHTCSITKLT